MTGNRMSGTWLAHRRPRNEGYREQAEDLRNASGRLRQHRQITEGVVSAATHYQVRGVTRQFLQLQFNADGDVAVHGHWSTGSDDEAGHQGGGST